jgi:hypothetical protein
MLPENTLAILARNERWRGAVATEPYECGWAREAVVFVRALAAEGMDGELVFAQVQVSPDGMRWVDEGTSVVLPSQAEGVEFAKVAHFGGWLRLAAELPKGASLTVIVSLHLKA